MSRDRPKPPSEPPVPTGPRAPSAASPLEDCVAAQLEARPILGVIQRKRMFGHRGFMVRGPLLVTAGTDGTDGLRVRADPSRSDELLARPGARQAMMGERDMGPSWITVDAAAVADEEALAGWIDIALGYNEHLGRN